MSQTRPSASAVAALASAAVACWVSFGALAFRGPDRSSGYIGLLPSPAWLAALLALAVLVALVWRPSPRTVAPLWLTVVLIVPWLPLPLPLAAFVWTGRMSAWVWAAAGAALVVPWVCSRSAIARWFAQLAPGNAAVLAGALAAVIYGGAAWRTAPSHPSGDEPHYLVVAQSLLKDGDLQAENNYRQRDFAAYYPGDIRPDYVRRGQSGAIYSSHAPGLSVLVLPVFAFFGYAGTVVLLVTVSACTAAVTWWLAWRVTARAGSAWFAWSTLLAAPVLLLSNAVFPDGVAPLLVAIGALPLVEPRARSPRALALVGAAIMLLPWLHTRLAIVAGALGLLIIVRVFEAPDRWRRAGAFLAIPVLGLVAWLAFFWVIYGTLDPSAPIGKPLQVSLIAPGVLGLLFDQRFGLLATAPVYLCAIAGGVQLLAAGSRRIAIEGLVLVLPYTLMIGAWDMWWGGTSPPARFLVPLCPVLAVAAGACVSRIRGDAARVGVAALASLTLLMAGTMVWVDRGALIFAERGQPSPLLSWLSPVVDLSAALPDGFQQTPMAVLLVGVLWLAVACVSTLAAVVDRPLPRRVVIGLAGQVLLTLAVSVAWDRHEGALTRPFEGGARVAAQLASGAQALGVAYPPFRRQPLSTLPPLIPLAEVRATPKGNVTLSVGVLPAGTYEVAGSMDEPAARGAIGIRTDRRSPLLVSAPIAGATWAQQIALPVAVSGLQIDAIGDTAVHVQAMTLRMVSPLPRGRQVFPGMVAGHGARYGPVVFYNMGGRSWLEPPGIWVGGRDGAEFAVATDRPGPLRLLVRNGGVANHVTADSGGWHVSLDLGAGEARTIEVPVDPRQAAIPLRVVPSIGFRPIDLDPSAVDDRFLGVWIEPADLVSGS